MGVVLFNHGEQDFVIQRGDRVAQLVLERISMADAVEVDELAGSERGADGFGSTGINAAGLQLPSVTDGDQENKKIKISDD